MGQLVHTICMDTSDAIRKSEGEFTMQLGGSNPRINPVRVMIGSIEFPIVQYTIENSWNRIYISEGISINDETQTIKIEEKCSNTTNTTVVHIPQTLNKIVEIRRNDKLLFIRTLSLTVFLI